MSTIANVNKMLKAAGREERLVRGGGYYYVSNVAVSSALYVYRLDDEDLPFAIDHVEGVLTEQDGKPFKFAVKGA